MADCIVLPPRDLWPVGFRFHPTDEELINHYLKNKMLGKESLVQYIPQVDICRHEPWELPSLSNDHTTAQEWFFFSAQDFKYSNGRRSNRATRTGYWKSTGKDRKIMPPGTNKLIGTKKTLVFYSGRVPNGIRTNWVIHEYHLHSDPNFAHLRSFVICLLKRKPDENDVLICDEAEPNGRVNSTFEDVATVNQNQEIPGNGQSLFQPDLQVLDYDFPDLQSPLFSDPEPISMDFQAINSYGTHVNNEDIEANCFHEGTPNSSISDFNWEELLHSDDQNQGGGFSGDTGMDATLRRQYYGHASHSLLGEHSCSRVQTESMPIIKESRRSPLTSKILRYGGGKHLSSSTRPREDELHINCISYLSDDDSDREIKTFRSQREPKSHKVVNHVNASQNVQSKRETQIQVVSSPDKAKAVSNGIAYRSKSTGHGPLQSRGKCSSSGIPTTRSSPSAYAARACIGFILFVTVARQVLLFGKW